jgi:hypothetical protein
MRLPWGCAVDKHQSQLLKGMRLTYINPTWLNAGTLHNNDVNIQSSIPVFPDWDRPGNYH